MTPVFRASTEAPEIDLDAKLKQGLTVRATCPIRLCATVRGRPPPKVSWRRMGVDNVVRRGKVDIIDTMTFLLIPDSTRDDSGKYCLTVQSAAGEKAVFVNVKVLGMSSAWRHSDALQMIVYHINVLFQILLDP